MPLASLLLALSLGQSCRTPSSAWDPPPCSVANVPGCLPGYLPRSDRFGRLIYACDPNYVPPPGETPQPTQAPPYSQAPQPPQSPLQAGVALPPAPPGNPPPEAYSPVAPPEGRGHVGVVFMPGVSAFPSYTHQLDRTRVEGQLALEFRGTEGGARLRLTGEYTYFGKIGELSVKYDFLDGFFLRPFLALGIGVASINPDPSLRGEGSASAGIDLYFGRDFFLTGELKGRLFTEGTQGRAQGLAVSDQRQTSLLVGMGFYFF
jgi:hypothetical protein